MLFLIYLLYIIYQGMGVVVLYNYTVNLNPISALFVINLWPLVLIFRLF
jgi:hypothetical protein